MATTLLPRTARESQGKTARPAMLNGQSAQSVAIVQSAAGVVSVAEDLSAVANAATAAMATTASRAKAEPTRRKLMRAVRLARNLAGMEEVKVALKVEGKPGTSAGQTATRVSRTQRKQVPPPTQRTALPTTQRRSVIRGSRLRDWMKAMARLKQARMPMADRDVKNVRATVMGVTVARVATARNVVTCRSAQSAASARTVRRLTISSRWRALPLIQEDQIWPQPP